VRHELRRAGVQELWITVPPAIVLFALIERTKA
jgi:hypothetical protein